MFDATYRETVQAALVEKARLDRSIVGAAAVGGSAEKQDRWSDIDLTFAVGGDETVEHVLADWTAFMVSEFSAAVLFDAPLRSIIYRVFLLPGALQVDLSFSPAAEFGALGPRFRLLFGDPVERPHIAAPPPGQVFGLGVHHVVRAHVCIERGRVWQAEHWIHEARDEALILACLRRGLEWRNGRAFDALPEEVRERFMATFAQDVHEDSLRRALAAVTRALLEESGAVASTAARVGPMLEEILGPQRGDQEDDTGTNAPGHAV